MFNKPLLLATAFFVLSIGASSRAATMSSDAGNSELFEPPAPNLSDLTTPGEVETQASAYFSPPDAGSVTPTSNDGFMTVGEEEHKRRMSAITWASSAFALGNFFSYNSELPAISVPSVPLEPGPGVAPVPELNSGMLVLLAIVVLGAMGTGRQQLGRRDPSTSIAA